MRYSIRQLYFFLVLFPGVAGLFLVIIFSSFFYRFNVDRVLEERAVNLQTLANTISSPFWVHQEILHIPGTIENFLQQTARVSDISFIRIVNVDTGIIEKSSDRKEIGQKIQNIPSFAKDIRIRDGLFNNQPIKELTIESKNRDYLWMGVSLQETQRSVLLSSIALGLSLMVLFGISGLLVLLVFSRSIANPLALLVSAFGQLERENYNVRLKQTPAFEIQRVFWSFNNTAEKIKATRERDAQVSRLKSEFISMAAHQLRTPLSIFKWLIRDMVDEGLGKTTKKMREGLTKAYATNERMITLVDDLLDVVEIEEGILNYAPKKQSAVDIIESTVEDMQVLANKNMINIEFRQPSKNIPAVQLDVDKFRIAAANIIENAILYTPKNGHVTVVVSRDQKKSILFYVQDSGIGISQKEIPLIFTRFFRGRQASSLNMNGSGLGLFIAKNIIEKHGGKIWVESEIDKGTTVYFTIPIK